MPKNETYTPDPIDTSDFEIPDELLELREELAKNVHEIWSAERIAQGWKYGPKRNNDTKEHNCLVPYEDLSDDEKEFDRKTMEGTIKAILRLGFNITG